VLTINRFRALWTLWMLTETVDGVCLPGMMSADLTITQQGRGCVTILSPVRAGV